MAKYTSGTYNTYWAPFVADESPDTGLTVVSGILLSGFLIREYADGTTSAYVSGSVFPAKMPLQVFVSKLPALLNDAGTNRAVVAGWPGRVTEAAIPGASLEPSVSTRRARGK